ncbi:MAG TPA: hypothetical protein VKV26_09330 [Dehalococcoidia bacterium]|nr:hypothetical protein [Dehalococcoidia bacterium]
MGTTWVKVGYGSLLGLVLALTAGFGSAIFISEPRLPQPVGVTFQQLSGNTPDAETAREAKQIDGYFGDVQNFKGKYPDYQRNIFIAFAVAGLIFAIIGVALPAIVNYLRFGFLIGGGLLLAAGAWFVIQPVPLGTENPSGILTLLVVGTPAVLDTAARFLRFAIALVGVLLLLFVGLWRLTEWSTATSAPAGAAAGMAAAPPPGPSSIAAATASVTSAPPPAESLKWARPDDRSAADFQPADAPQPARVIEHVPASPEPVTVEAAPAGAPTSATEEGTSSSQAGA